MMFSVALNHFFKIAYWLDSFRKGLIQKSKVVEGCCDDSCHQCKYSINTFYFSEHNLELHNYDKCELKINAVPREW